VRVLSPALLQAKFPGKWLGYHMVNNNKTEPSSTAHNLQPNFPHHIHEPIRGVDPVRLEKRFLVGFPQILQFFCHSGPCTYYLVEVATSKRSSLYTTIYHVSGWYFPIARQVMWRPWCTYSFPPRARCIFRRRPREEPSWRQSCSQAAGLL